MSADKGLGNCLIPLENGAFCGKQITEGEPIGTIVLNGPRVGHKKCADAYHWRKQQAERAKRENMVKRIDQAGPGGAVDSSTERDAVMGSLPLEKPEPPAFGASVQAGPPRDLASLAAAAGVTPISDVPMDVTPAEAATLKAQPPTPSFSPSFDQLDVKDDHTPSTLEELEAKLEEFKTELRLAAKLTATSPATYTLPENTHLITVDLSKVPPQTKHVAIMLVGLRND